MKLDKVISVINNITNHCPKCDSENISNEDGPRDGGLEITCHDCSNQWVDDDRYKQESMIKSLNSSGHVKEAEIIEKMAAAEYREFLKENFDIASLNQ
jgi:transposase-like protein